MFRNIFPNRQINKSISFISLYLISHSLRICLQISTNSLNAVFSIKIPENLKKMFVNNEITETNNWIRLLILYVKELIFIFSTCSLTSKKFTIEVLLHFMSSLFNNVKKTILKTHPPKLTSFNVAFALKLSNYTS